jgi:hypothetical protein
MKNFSKNSRSWRNAEKCISDSSEEHKSLQNCPEDLKKRGAKLLVSKHLPSLRWKNSLSHRMVKPSKSIRNTGKCVKNKLKTSKSDLDVVNEVLYFETSESSKNSPDEKFSFFLTEKERNLATDKSVATNETAFGSQKILSSALDSEKSIEFLNKFIKNSKDSVHINKLLGSQERRETGNCNNDETCKRNATRESGNINKKILDNDQDTLKECDDINLSQHRLKKVKKDQGEERPSSLDTLTPEHRLLYDCAVIIMEILTRFPKSKFSVVFMKIFNTLKMKENMSNVKALLEMMKKMMEALQPQPNSTDKIAKPAIATLAPQPKDSRKEALVNIFTMLNKPLPKVVLAEMTTKLVISSYNEAKDVLAKVFEIPYKAFAGLTRLPDPKNLTS